MHQKGIKTMKVCVFIALPIILHLILFNVHWIMIHEIEPLENSKAENPL